MAEAQRDPQREPQQIADAVAARMLARDRASARFGMTLLAIAPGQATMAMTVRNDMLNGLDTCHGGLITTLADSAFAFACNSHGELAVAASLTIDFIAPARLGDVLTAQATEVALAGRTSVRMARNFALDKHELAAGFVLTCQANPLTESVTLSFDER